LAGIVSVSYFEALWPVALLAGLVAAVTFHSPRALFLVWLILTCAIPAWFGAAERGFWEAGTLIGLIVLPGLGYHLLRSRLELNLGDGLVILLTLAVVGSVLVGDSPRNQAVNFCFVGLVPYALVRFLAPSLELNWIYRVTVIVLTVLAALATLELVTGIHPFTSSFPDSPTSFWADIQDRSGIARSEVTFGHSLALGGALAMAVPLALGSTLGRRWKVTTLVLLLLGVISTQSRSAMIAALLGILLFVFVQRFSRARDRAIIIGSTIALVLLFVGFFLLFFTDRESVDSIVHRGDIYSDLFPNFNFIGIADSFTISGGVSTFAGKEISIDSAVLQMGLLYGWLAVLIVTVGLLTPVVRVFSGKSSLPDIALAAQIPMLLSVWLITQYYPIVWMLIGLVVAAAGARKYRVKFKLLPEKWLRPGIPRPQG
jgi:hypothetical protein